MKAETANPEVALPNAPTARLAIILFSFKGRIGRGAFWAAGLVVGMIFAVSVAVTSVGERCPAFGIVSLIVVGWVGLAANVKRWHDLNHTGWLVLLYAVPFLGPIASIIVLGCVKGTNGRNYYGAGPLILNPRWVLRVPPRLGLAVFALVGVSLVVGEIWLVLISPIGVPNAWRVYHENVRATQAAGLTPCVVCGRPGTERQYRFVGRGLPNPFAYQGPFIYCSEHTSQSPNWPFLRIFISAAFLVGAGLFVAVLQLVALRAPRDLRLVGLIVCQFLFAVLSTVGLSLLWF